MSIGALLNAVRGCVESRHAVDEWWAFSPADTTMDGKRRLLIRAYSFGAVDIRCMLGTPRHVVLAMLGLTLDDLRGTDGKLPPSIYQPEMLRRPRIFDTRRPVRVTTEQ